MQRDVAEDMVCYNTDTKNGKFDEIIVLDLDPLRFYGHNNLLYLSIPTQYM
jgi:hypothetical protein